MLMQMQCNNFLSFSIRKNNFAVSQSAPFSEQTIIPINYINAQQQRFQSFPDLMHLLFTLHASIANRLIVFDKIVNLTILVQGFQL